MFSVHHEHSLKYHFPSFGCHFGCHYLLFGCHAEYHFSSQNLNFGVHFGVRFGIHFLSFRVSFYFLEYHPFIFQNIENVKFGTDYMLDNVK